MGGSCGVVRIMITEGSDTVMAGSSELTTLIDAGRCQLNAHLLMFHTLL